MSPRFGQIFGRKAKPAVQEEAELWTPEGEGLDLLRDQEIVVPFVGAGVSQAIGLPGSAELRDSLMKQFKPHPEVGAWSDETSLLAVAEDIAYNDHDLSDEVRTAVAQFWLNAVQQTKSNGVAENLAQVPSKLIVTFNYDLSLEKGAQGLGMNPVSLSTPLDCQRFEAAVRSTEPPNELTILHYHGSADDPRTIVIDSIGYQGIARNGNVSSLLAALIDHRRVCFLGTQLDEPEFLTALTQAPTSPQPHPLFAAKGTVTRIQSRVTPTRARQSIAICPMPSQDHMRGVIRHLIRSPVRPEAIPDEPSAEEPSREPDPDYVPTVITRCDSERDEGAINYLAELAYSSRSSPFATTDEEFFTEGDVATGNRNLVIGAPGGGKSELLRYLGGVVPAHQRPVLIQLNQVQLDVADPRTRLERWAARGEGLRGETPIGQEALDSETFHFLLDGLDEVPPPVQTRMAKYVLGVAEAYPQHAFTLTTRPVEAVAAFRSDVWRCLILAPGSVWQRRYLEHRGVELGAILGSLQGAADLRELLQLPFFLTRITALYKDGALDGLDLWGVLRALVDEAVESEEARELLPISADAAKTWLRDAALAMQLAGKTVVPLTELQRIKLPGDETPDVGEMCEALVQRAMLQHGPEGYGFSHRIIGESLAAEALSERQPTDQLLDSIAPYESDTVRGVRSNFLFSMALLLPNSQPWLEAIKPRDPMQWARSVPSEADIETRREAAELIWNTYRDWKIWIWSRELPDALEDGSALARLIRGGELDDLVSAIHEAIDDPSPQTQGNAIRVLAEAGGVQSLEEDFLRVLKDEDREAVVRRQAAISAAELGYHGLLDPIIERANQTAESVETQDCALAAMRLATDDEVLDVALRLLETSDARMVVMPRIEDRLAPRDMLHFLRGYAPREPRAYSTDTARLAAVVERLEDAGAEEITNVAYVALVWEVTDEPVRALLDRDHLAALKGISEAISEGPADWWDATRLLDLFSPEELEQAGADTRLIEIRRSWDQPREVREVAEPPEDEEKRPPTLSEALSQPRNGWDYVIQHNAHHFSNQVSDLSPDEQNDLRTRLLEWWEDKPFENTITWKERTPTRASWSIENWAAGWIWYGPALDMELNPDQWAGIASAGILFEEQMQWLHRQASEEAKLKLAEITGGDGRTWREALRATPDPLPQSLVDAAVAALKAIDPADSNLEEFLRRLSDHGNVSALRQLAQGTESVRDTALPYLALAGDDQAIQAALEALKARLNQGERPDAEELFWLEGVRDRRYLESIFECMVLAYRPGDTPRPWTDTTVPLVGAIREIGGVEAIALYDKALEEDEELRFLRFQRDALAETELAERGLLAGPAAAESAGVPLLEE